LPDEDAELAPRQETAPQVGEADAVDLAEVGLDGLPVLL
jgi:hypothetical protein